MLKTACKGFTLIEVMVALFIVAMAVSAILFQMTAAVDNTAYLRNKLVANWVALNQQSVQRIANRRYNTVLEKQQTGSETQLDQEWFWQIEPEQTSEFTRLTITVSEQRDGPPLVRLFTFTDQYHQY